MPDNKDDLSRFSAKLMAAQKKLEEKPQTSPVKNGLGIGMRIGIELLSGIAVGGGIGYYLDQVLDSAPWFMIVFLLMGGVAGVLNAYRAAQGLDQTVGIGKAMKQKDLSFKETPGGQSS